jgi:serine protease Do
VARAQTWCRRIMLLVAVLALAVPPAAAQVGPLSAWAIDQVDQAVVQVAVARPSDGRVVRGSGSGVIIDASGLVLTAEHVISGMASIDVALRTGQVFPAKVVGIDPVYDVALLRIDAGRLPFVSLGSSSLLEPGEVVVAVGRAPRRQTGPSQGTFLQVDYEARPGAPYLVATATVYPGDSGGALVNSGGEVVGIILAITRNGLISLSIASDAVAAVMTDLRAGGVRHPWLGITGRTITEDLVAELGLGVQHGVLIFEVLNGTPAMLAGLRGGRPGVPRDIPRGGDIITGIDGRPVDSFGALATYILSKRIGEVVTLEIVRDGQTFTTTVVLAERPTL